MGVKQKELNVKQPISLVSNMSAEQDCRDNIHMHKSRLADARPGRTLNQLTNQLRSCCALIGQNRVKAEVHRAGDSPREVPNSALLCNAHARARTHTRAHTHTHTHGNIFNPAFGIFVSQDWTALVSKQQIESLRVSRMKVRQESVSGREGS